MIHELRLFFTALQFFTRVPVPGWVGYAPEWMAASARHFPLVGACVGAVAVGVLGVASLVFPLPVAVVLAMLSTACMTGAFHEDGLADTFDALGGAVSRERALEIMKDSRIGSYGAVSLLLVLGLKAAVLISLPLVLAVPAWLLAHVASRAAPVLLIRGLPYAGDVSQTKAKPLAGRVSAATVGVALAWVLLLALALLAWQSAWWLGVTASLGMVVVGTLLCARWFRQRLGGITGDTLGATQQITEVLALLGWLATLRWPELAAAWP